MSEPTRKERMKAMEEEKTAIELEQARVYLERDLLNLETHQRELDTPESRGIFRLTGPITSKSVKKLEAAITAYAAAPEQAITLYISSGGGESFAGFQLFDTLRTLSGQGHLVTTVGRGYCGSMAGVLLQAGDVRLLGAQSYLHMHETSTLSHGKTSELADDVDLLRMLDLQASEIFAARSHLSVRQVEKLKTRREAWLPSKKALKLGLVDGIG